MRDKDGKGGARGGVCVCVLAHLSLSPLSFPSQFVPTLTTGQDFLHSWRHFLGLQLAGVGERGERGGEMHE